MSPPSPWRDPSTGPLSRHRARSPGCRRAAEHVADEELALALLACREQSGQNGFHPRQQFSANRFAFGVEITRNRGRCVSLKSSIRRLPAGGLLRDDPRFQFVGLEANELADAVMRNAALAGVPWLGRTSRSAG
jgi:hypothetical protein